MRLEGKVALISGAAAGIRGEKMGFGGATAWVFAREGARVVLGDVNRELGEKTAAQIRETGAEALFVPLEVRREQDWRNAVATTVSHFGRLDILVNSAGITSPADKVEDTPIERWERMLAIHTTGTFLGTKHAIPEMRRAGGGSIVNMSSMHGIVGCRSAEYSAAKGAIRNFTKACAIQYGAEGIRVNSIHPGNADTAQAQWLMSDPEWVKLWEQEAPLGRIGTADEIAYCILYLASDESSYVTGAELVVDGGILAK